MSAIRKKKRGRKRSRSKKTKNQRQEKNFKAFRREKEKQLKEGLKDKAHLIMVMSVNNYMMTTYSNKNEKKLYGTFRKSCWLLPNWYFRTIQKGVRVNLLYQEGFREKDGMVWMLFPKKKEVLMDAKNTKNLEWFKLLFQSRRYVKTRSRVLI